MTEIIVIVGLPGSGKTTLLSEFVSPDTHFIDDFDFSHVEELRTVIQSGLARVVITDVHATTSDPAAVEGKLKSWLGEDITVRFIPFENDLEGCWANVQRRRDGRLISKASMRAMSMRYVPEAFGEVRSIYRPES